jgi:hypothetical protein
MASTPTSGTDNISGDNANNTIDGLVPGIISPRNVV